MQSTPDKSITPGHERFRVLQNLTVARPKGRSVLYRDAVDCCDFVEGRVAERPVVEGARVESRADSPRAALHHATLDGAGPSRTSRSPGAGLRRGSTLGAVAVALLPKCPACWSAYAGLSSLLGLSFVVEQRYLLPLTAALLGLALAALGLQARRQRRYAPWLLACAAASATLAGKFAFDQDAILYTGIGGLLLASLWSSCRWSRLLPRRASLPVS